MVNTGQYESEWSLEIFKWLFWWLIEKLGLFIEEAKLLFCPCQGHLLPQH